MRHKNKSLIGVIPLFSLILLGCSENHTNVVYESDEFGYSVFNAEQNNDEFGYSLFNAEQNSDDTTVIFFDDDNVVTKDGNEFVRPKRKVSCTLGSSDCYMVKSGSTELLVDGGYQSITSYGSVKKNGEDDYQYNDEYIKNECDENLLRKIASVISSDGVLDYLIVTHADFDHIAALTVTGGIFDAFLNHQTITTFAGNKIRFDKINYIVDFDSGLVKKFSDESIDKSKRLVGSDYYQAYASKRDKLVQNGSNYCPASAFFDNENLKNFGVEIADENKAVAMPDKIIARLDGLQDSSVQYILDEDSNNGVDNTKDSSYGKCDMFSEGNGSIQSVEAADSSERYYYSLKFDSGELRILYNWHYDYIFHSSFNKDGGDTQSSDQEKNIFDSQDANNISVCFEVVKNGFKFLSLGDLGGNGENGLVKYYQGTGVLSDVSLMKASHHGSSYNGENSEELFRLAKPKTIVITGCANYKDPSWQDATDDKVVSALVGRTKLSQKLFDNISSAFREETRQPLIMCTNINSQRFANDTDYFESAPFYGDIKVKNRGDQLHISNSYIGSIRPYVSQKWNAEYQKANKKEFTFTTRSGKEILSLQNTDWFSAVGFEYGGQ